MNSRRRTLLASMAICAAVVLAACSSSSSKTPVSAAASSSHSASASASASPAASVSVPPAATGPVPPPVSGNISQTVAPSAVATKSAALTKPADFGGGVSVHITSTKAITATAKRPGEVAGPAVALTVEVANSSSKPISLQGFVITVADSAGGQGSVMSDAPAQPIGSSVAANSSATGVYVFTVPVDRRSPITVTVTYAAGAPVFELVGDVS